MPYPQGHFAQVDILERTGFEHQVLLSRYPRERQSRTRFSQVQLLSGPPFRRKQGCVRGVQNPHDA